MPRPPVSVVVPCFNAALTLAESLASVLDQTRRACEVIVVDDGSTDGSAAVARRLPVRMLHAGARRGAAAARWLGITTARGDYVAFADADGRWAPDHLAATAALLDEHPAAALAGADAEDFGLGTLVRRAELPVGAPGPAFRQAFDAPCVAAGAMVARRAPLQAALAEPDPAPAPAGSYLVTLRLAARYLAAGTGRVTAYVRHRPAAAAADARRAALHRHRARFIAEVRGRAAPDVAARLERRAAELWARDLAAAGGDAEALAALLAVRDLVPGLAAGEAARAERRAHAVRLAGLPGPRGLTPAGAAA